MDASARTASDSSAGPLATLAALVVKEGVGLGGLPAGQRMAALALAWSALPWHTALRESEVNVALKRFLAEEGQFLQTDHVELRRWLVDGGWLTRDGFGHAYRRVAVGELPLEWRSLAQALDRLDPVSWATGIREQLAAKRGARRRAWLARRDEQTSGGETQERSVGAGPEGRTRSTNSPAEPTHPGPSDRGRT